MAALLVGLLVGGAGVAAAWALTGGDSTPQRNAGADSDAHGACAALAGLDESEILAKGKQGEQALYRFAGAVDLATAAAAGDSAYGPLAETLTRSRNRYQQVFGVDADVKENLAEARSLCAGL
ncbi:hypothetical protein [Streptomyces sp. NPDC085937]|uniref:hypothetical protein n=1 Tax=Streptomyces sp. NPDC085937 TaxID=3365742 RepID=UPI0037D29820